MEDKGLEPERGVNFQKTIVKRLNELEANANPVDSINYQLIYATSFVVDELNTDEYTVGDYYTQENKSLKNVI